MQWNTGLNMIGFAALLMGSTAISPTGESPPDYTTAIYALFNGSENLGTGTNLQYFGNIRRNTANPRFGTGCLQIGPNAALANFPASDSQLTVGTSDFTCEFWFNCDGEPTSQMHLFGKWYTSSLYNVYRIYYNNTTDRIVFEFRDSSVGTTRTVFFQVTDPTDFFSRWNHVAFQRRGTVVECFVNGVAGTTYTIGALGLGGTSMTFAWQFGGSNTSSWISNQFVGLIDEFRITIGSARYTSAFSPPTEPFPIGIADPNWSNVRALLNFNDPFGYVIGGEVANKDTNTTKVSQDNVMFSISDLGLNFGNTQTTEIPVIDNAIDLGSEDFTFEFWGTMGSTSSTFFTSSGVVPIRVERSVSAVTITVRSASDAVIFTRSIPISGSSYRTIAISRKSGVISTFMDGVRLAVDPAIGEVAPYLGKNIVLSTNGSSGNLHLKAFRFTKGAGLYDDATYDAPSAESVLI